MVHRATKVGLCLAVASIATVVAWSSGLKWCFIPKRWEAVEAGVLYRSGNISPRLVKRTWETNHIKVVIVMGHDDPGNRQHECERRVASELGIERAVFPLNGQGMGDPASYVGAIKAIVQAHREGKPAVVHCAAGVYRTGGVIAVHRVLVDGWSGSQAYEEMIAHGIRPDSPILEYLNQHLPEIGTELVKEGVIEHKPEPWPVFAPDHATARGPLGTKWCDGS